jgi:hypothetical protein
MVSELVQRARRNEAISAGVTWRAGCNAGLPAMSAQQPEEHQKQSFTTHMRRQSRQRIMQADGHVWLVSEHSDPVTAAATLVFTTTGFARRVRTFPRDWHKLSDEALYALSWSP